MNHSPMNHLTIHHSYLCELCLLCGFLIVIRIKSVKIRSIRGYFFFKTNPIYKMPEMNLNKVLTRDYGNVCLQTHPKNKPNQTQYEPNSNPIQSQFTK